MAHYLLLVLLLVLMNVEAVDGQIRPIDSFTYQGQLTDGSAPANGTYDLQFKLFDAATNGTQKGSTVTKDNVNVANGVFTVQLNFVAGLFDGNARFLELGVRPGASTGAYQMLSPRQALNAAPYALFSAASAAPWVTNGSDISFSNGKVGIGTPSPTFNLHVLGAVAGTTGVYGMSTNGIAVTGTSNTHVGVKGVSNSGVGVWAESASGNLVEGYSLIGGAKFHITNAGTYVTGSDFAEALPARGGTAGYEPGDVLVLSTGASATVEKSSRPYDVRLTGVYSTRPGILGADKDGTSRVDADELPVAIVGIVPTKVSTENGPVQAGDLLATSATPGHAMKASPVPVGGVDIYRTGTILGKALEPLQEGTGVIKVLVTLR